MNLKFKENKKIECLINEKNIKIDTKYFFIETWGCQMNEEDSEKLAGMLKILNYSSTSIKEEADIIIFNTCCIRENAENKVVGNLGELKRLKVKNPSLVIAICGCMMQQKDSADKILQKFPFIDIIFGTHNAHKFPEYLNRVLQHGTSIKEIVDKEEGIIEGIPIERKSLVKAFVTIMYGCNNFCTYCIVPYVRGRERSRKSDDIANDIIKLVSQGYKEVTLLGQNVNSYGKGLEEDIDFARLLRRLNEINGLERLKFMTSHPKDISMDVIRAIRDCDKICEQIHLPVQSGSNGILKAMNRHYTREQYLDIINNIKKEIPRIGITTDLIIGFPGETEEDFKDTLALVNEVKYDSSFTFIYSRRNNTPADKMENQIPEDIKHDRFNRVIEAINKHSKTINQSYLNEEVEILVEDLSKNNDENLSGRTREGKLVNFKGDKYLIGSLVKIKIEEAKSFSLFGSLIQ
ncbi:tRNA (N6-isopentenyl adenosine(37)-C2)-methylthiotransferase MiaB [uncultured Clostridium sp.]|jgi:tRNA-2-methylthio-N6-dimethylallyladenosine synthase|uniref:tRNA (N6-isopentenyl adenosine(37)-C2)-methylthiotransferase MiaB n=1 Tax=uncultured Clostridium sp. TaxID=59620 RepID=UPI00260A5BF4|nr:tRNA (N6-isopentenyl adenosine(37)-C2)-methylthiotransferase MiaB [uncultured Clostridium sp.]